MMPSDRTWEEPASIFMHCKVISALEQNMIALMFPKLDLASRWLLGKYALV